MELAAALLEAADAINKLKEGEEKEEDTTRDLRDDRTIALELIGSKTNYLIKAMEQNRQQYEILEAKYKMLKSLYWELRLSFNPYDEAAQENMRKVGAVDG